MILLNAGAIDTNEAESTAARQSVTETPGKQLRLIKFGGPIQPEWYAMLKNSGVTIVDYIPNFTYLVYGGPAEVQRLSGEARKSSSPIKWEGA